MVRHVIYLAVALLMLLAWGARSQTVQLCARCQRVLNDDRVMVEGRSYHSVCFTCAECGKPIGGLYYNYQSNFFDERCYEELFRASCRVCAQTMEGEFYENYWGERYCVSHQGSIPECAFCTRLIMGATVIGGVQLPDGRLLCGGCQVTAVTAESQAKRLLCEASNRMESLGLTVDCSRGTVELVSQDTLKVFMPDPRHSPLGYTFYQGIPIAGKFKQESFNILLLNGMPAVEARSVIAHELMHVWFFDHGISNAGTPLCEGSCNYAIYLFLSGLDTPDAEFIIDRMDKDTDPVYGQGFRDVRKYVESNGVMAWLQMLCD